MLTRMLTILLGMAAIILAGTFWRQITGMEAATTLRAHLVRAVYEIFLPALVLRVMWQSPVDLNMVRVPLLAWLGVFAALGLAALIYRGGRWFAGEERERRAMAGALLLAASFGNITYLGLPVLTQTYGAWAASVAIQYDLFVCTPLLFTVGLLLASRFGSGAALHPLHELLRVPALYGAVAGVLLSLLAIPMPGWLLNTLTLLGSAVVPLMLLSIGMALRWQAGWLARLPLLLPAVAIKLALAPLLVWGGAVLIAMPANLLAPTVLEAAMPTMVLGLVLCDRFRLDTALYAEAVTVSTALALFTLPFWHRLAG